MTRIGEPIHTKQCQTRAYGKSQNKDITRSSRAFKCCGSSTTPRSCGRFFLRVLSQKNGVLLCLRFYFIYTGNPSQTRTSKGTSTWVLEEKEVIRLISERKVREDLRNKFIGWTSGQESSLDEDTFDWISLTMYFTRKNIWQVYPKIQNLLYILSILTPSIVSSHTLQLLGTIRCHYNDNRLFSMSIFPYVTETIYRNRKLSIFLLSWIFLKL